MDGSLWHCTGGSDQDHPQGKEVKKGKMVVWGGLTNSCEKKRSEKERYKHLNAEFQRIARRNKKAFLSDQCKEIEENNWMGKTRDLFKKIRDTKGNISCKDGLDKGQKWYWPNRRGGKNTQKNCTKKIFTTQIITMVWSLTSSQTSWNVKSSGP